MTKKEILAIVKTAPHNDTKLPFSVIEEMTTLNVLELTLSPDGKSYIYKVKIEDLVDKDVNPDYLYDPGWNLSIDEEYIYKII
jgi:hypothetical protein